MICSAKIIDLHAAQQKREPFWNTPFKPGRNIFPIQTSCVFFSVISLFTSVLENILLSFILRVKWYKRFLNSRLFPLVLFLCHYKCPREDTFEFYSHKNGNLCSTIPVSRVWWKTYIRMTQATIPPPKGPCWPREISLYREIEELKRFDPNNNQWLL